MASPWGVIWGMFGSVFSVIGKYWWVLIIVAVLGILGAVLYFLTTFKKSSQRWDVRIRVRQEDNQYGKIYIDPTEVRGRRVTLSNGLRLIYLEKEILGKSLFPLLNYHTRPGVYDIIVTSDNRIFIVTGIDGIDEQRKTLKVGLRYPGIDYSLDEVNRDHAKLNQLDRKNDLLGIVKAGAVAVIAIVIMIMFIVGSTKYVELRKINSQISDTELRLLEGLEAYQLRQNENTNGMIVLTKELRDLTGSTNLRTALS